jgi:hypothetical protein
MASVIGIGCDEVVTWTGATAGGAYLNAATVTYSLKTATGTTLGSGTLTYTAASSGDYAGTIESTVTSLLTEGAVVYVEYTLVSGSYNDFRRREFVARYRD